MRATGNPRFFRVRTIKGPTTIEKSVALLGNCDVLTPDVRFFAEEFRPNGRIALSRGNKTLRVFEVPHFAELRSDPWKAHESVVSARARLREVESRRGWQWYTLLEQEGRNRSASVLLQSAGNLFIFTTQFLPTLGQLLVHYLCTTC